MGGGTDEVRWTEMLVRKVSDYPIGVGECECLCTVYVGSVDAAEVWSAA